MIQLILLGICIFILISILGTVVAVLGRILYFIVEVFGFIFKLFFKLLIIVAALGIVAGIAYLAMSFPIIMVCVIVSVIFMACIAGLYIQNELRNNIIKTIRSHRHSTPEYLLSKLCTENSNKENCKKNISQILEELTKKGILVNFDNYYFHCDDTKEKLIELFGKQKYLVTLDIVEHFNMETGVSNELISFLVKKSTLDIVDLNTKDGVNLAYTEAHNIDNLQCTYCKCVLEDTIIDNDMLFCSVDCQQAYQFFETPYIFGNIKRLSNVTEQSNDATKNTNNFEENMGGAAAAAYNLSVQEQIKMFATPRGHGFAAEQANNMLDRFQFKDARVIGGDNLKNGADRIVDGVLIQSKYCSSGSKCISECFGEDGMFRYLDSSGNPMKIEVPSDQYDAALKAMEARIRKGQVPNVENVAEAKNIVKAGTITYQQAKNIAKAGTIESICFDSVNGIKVAGAAGSLSFIVSFANSLWNGKDSSEALQNACHTGIKVGSESFVVSLACSQIAKTSLGVATKNMSANVAASVARNLGFSSLAKSAAVFAKNNVVVASVTVVVMSISDLFQYFDNHISKEELIIRVAKTGIVVGSGFAGAAVGGAIAGRMVGAKVGATVGSIIPGLGTMIGFGIGSLLGNVINDILFDAKEKGSTQKEIDLAEENRRIGEMYDIFRNHFCKLAEEYLLTPIEFEKVAQTLKEQDFRKILLKMYTANNKVSFVACLTKPLIFQVLSERKMISCPNDQEIFEKTANILQNVAVA